MNAVLHDQFAGDVSIGRIGGLGLRGVDGVSFRVKDPEGIQVLAVDGARVRLRTLDAARSFLFGKGDIAVAVDEASIVNVDASIDGDPAGNLRLANAFAARHPTPPKPSDPNARGVRVDAPTVRLTHAWVHGQAPGAPPLDSDLDDLVAHAHYDPKLTRADLERVDLRTRGLPRAVDPRGRVVAHLAMPSATGKDMGVDASFDGHIAGIPTSLHGTMDGQKIDAVVDGHDATGQGMRATFGEVGIQEEVTLHAEAHGELPKIAAKARLGLGRGTADLDGNVDLSDGTKADATLAVRHIDARGIVPSAPATDVGLDARGHFEIAKSGAMSANGSLETLPGKVAGESLPILRARGELANGVGHGSGTIADSRGTADFDVTSKTASNGDSLVAGTVHANVPDFSRLPKIGGTKLAGHASVDAKAAANLGQKTFDATAHVVGGKIAYGAQTVDSVTVLATAQGSMDHPVVDVGVHAGSLASGEQKIGVAEVRARIEPGASTTVRNAHVDIVKEGITIGASAERVEVAGTRMTVDGAVVTGFGEPIRANVSRNAQEMHVVIDAPSVDLRRVAVAAGQGNALKSGHLAINGDVVLGKKSATGELHAKVDSLSAGKVEGGSLSLDANFDGKNLGLDIDAQMADAGTFKLVTKDVVIGGSPLDINSWKRAHGRAKFDGHFDMAKVATLVPEQAMPFSELRGSGVLAGVIRRDSADVPPEMSVHFHTRGLVVAGKGAPEPLHDVAHKEHVTTLQPWRSEGVDVSVEARVDATSGAGELAFHAVDKKGTVAAFDVKADLPYQESLADPSKAMALLQKAPISAKIVIPKRALKDMPQVAGVGSMPGTFEAELGFTGTVMEPRVELAAHARGVRSPTLAEKMASDVDVKFDYDGEKGDLVASASAEKHRVLDMTAHVDLRSKDLLVPTGEPLEWGGSAKMKLGSFPLESLGPLADLRVRGHVSGEASIDDLHRDAKVHAALSLDNLKVGRAQYKSGVVTFDAKDGKALAHARLEQTDGYADVTANTDLAWGAALVPMLDPNANVEARLDAKAFRAAVALPFVRTVFNELDGRIDANATAKIGPGFKEATLTGKLSYHDGTLQMASFGDEFKDARATVTFQPGGVIAIDDVYMRSADGELTAKGNVKTRGLGLGSASASLHIPNRHALDISAQGQPIGAVAGDVLIGATASADGKLLKVQVDVPKMNVTLPQKMKSGVQELGETESIRVGTFRDEKTFVRLPLDKEDLAPPPTEVAEPGMVIDADIRLGDITIVQGNMARVVVGGNPHVRVAQTTEVTGQIVVKEGKIDVQGKQFEIEKGTVTFQPEDTSNPIVVATAAWTAEDGSKIYADFVGPVKTGKVNLRSDPARPKNEILAMILFGTADGANAQPPPPGRAPDGTTKAATSLGGGFAAQGLTEAMDDLTGIQATARIDTTRSTNPAPEIEFQLARRISLAFEHILGTPPISEPDTNLAIVDWRFRRNWSLETTVGDRGKVQADAVWTKRY